MTPGKIAATVSTSTMGLEQHLPCLQGKTTPASAFRKAFLDNLKRQIQREFGDTPLDLQDSGEGETMVDPGEQGSEETAAALGQ